MSRQSPLAASLGLALLVALGLGVVWGAVTAWCETMVDDWLRRNNDSRNVQVLLDGTPTVTSHRRSDYSIRTVRTLEGKEITAEQGTMGSLPGTHLPGLYQYSRQPRMLPWAQRLAAFSDNREPPAHWFFVHNGTWEGSGCFVGYDKESKLRIGYLGTAGFRDAPPPPDERFAMDGRVFGCRMAMTAAYGPYEIQYISYGRSYEGPGGGVPSWTSFMISGDRILRCDFRRGKSEKIMDLPRAIGLSWIYRASSLSEEKKRPRWEPRPMLLAIRTLEHLVIANTDGKELERYTIPESLRADSVTFYLLDNRTVLAQAYQRREGGQVAELTWFDLGGRTLRRESVVANEASILGRPAAENWLVMTFLPSPVAMLGAAVMDVHQHGALEAGGNWGPALGRAVSDRWPPLAAVSLLSAALAWLCYCRQRRYALPGTGVWVAFVFLAGVPGLLGYLLHRRWPVLEPCPACAKTAPRDREACAHCRSEFPRPAPRGIEVFA